jgi:nucleoside-diphosphate-sugar epimerase
MIMRAVKTSPSSFEDCSNLMFDLCHVNDIVEAALLAAQAPRLSGEVVNIGSGSAVTFREIAELAPGLLGARPDSDDDFSEIPPAHPCYLDITAARKLLGYNPKVQFGELMRRTLSRLRMSDRN